MSQENNASTKRQRIGDDANNRTFALGTIKRVRVKNFMTYNYVELTASANLNVILGPNGTGKSSIVCALCLALAGRTRLLARQSELRDFVRRGATQGYAEVTISGGPDGRDKVIRREINTKDNSSVWKINGRVSQIQDVEKLKKDMNVQLDNLLQFMPQDRVIEFSNLSPVQLLEETERAIGDAELYKDHQDVISLGRECQRERQKRDEVQKALERETDRKLGMERDVARFEKRQELLDEADKIDSKISWIRVWNAEKEVEKITSQLEKTEESTRRKRERLEALEAPFREASREVEVTKKDRTAVRQRINQTEPSLQKFLDSMTTLTEGIDNKAMEIRNLDEESKRYHENINRKEQEIKDWQNELEHYPEFPQEKKKRMEELKALQQDLTVKGRSERSNMDQVKERIRHYGARKSACERKIAEGDIVRVRKVQELEKRRFKWRGLANAYEWVKENKNKFRGEVCGPIIAEVSVSNEDYANYLEQHISLTTWSCFVTQFEEDAEKLRYEVPRLGIMKEINVSCVTTPLDEPLHRPDQVVSFPEFGVQCTLTEVFEAPMLVKQCLKNESGISEAYVGDRTTENCLERFLNQHQSVSCVWLPQSCHRIRVSRYGQVRSTHVISTRPSQILSIGLGARARNEQIPAALEEINQVLSQLDGELKEHQSAFQQIESEHQKISGEYQQHRGERDQLQKEKAELVRKIAAMGRALNNAKSKSDPKEKEAAIQRQLTGLQDRQSKTVRDLRATLKKFYEMHKKVCILDLMVKEKETQLQCRDASAKELRNSIKHSQHLISQAKRVLQQEHQNLRQLKSVAEERYPMSDELKTLFEDLPDDQGDLQDISRGKRDEANSIVCNNMGVMAQYQRTCEEIDRLQGQLIGAQSDFADMDARVKEVKDRWLPKLKETVVVVNKSFSENFARIGSAGEVRLAAEDRFGEDYSKYAMEILVKFRPNEEMKPLDSARQSGGERSVSTMLYLISLQAVTRTPFRVVDEINQGMDAVNERKIFDLLVATAALEGTPQCFLLTPKLLPNLSCSPAVTIHTIFNGPEVKALPEGADQENMIEALLGKRCRQFT